MIPIQILEADDPVLGTDWCRPLDIETMSGGMSDSISFKSAYSGTPENNAKWVRVWDVFGAVWRGSMVCQLPGNLRMEFVRGEIPKTHQLNMKDYRSLRGLWEGRR